jgi:hypothetical protein
MKMTLLLVISMTLLLCGCETVKGMGEKPADLNTRLTEAQVKIQESQSAVQVEAQKRITTLQLEVIKQCVADKHIPVFLNGNVDCKK